MLNEKLQLNQEIFAETTEMVSIRDGLQDALLELGEKNKDIVVLTADLRDSVNIGEFAKRFPERFFECGVAEQNMVGVASGLAASGKIPFIASYAVFSPGRNWEQIRTTVCYNNVPVKIIGAHAGLMTGPDGATHQALEDIALMRTLPNMTVFTPCDYNETVKVIGAIAQTRDPAYVRLVRPKTPRITTQATPFDIGRAYVVWEHESPVTSIIVSGPMVYYALCAARSLASENIFTEVLHIPTIKPLDAKTVIDHGHVSRAFVILEDHQVSGGLGGAVSELCAREYPLPIEFVGVQDRFGESGKPEELLDKYGLHTEDIAEAVKRVIKRK